MTQQRHPALSTVTAAPVAPAPMDFAQASVGLARWYLEYRSGRRSLEQVHTLLTAPLRGRLRARSSDRLAPPEIDPIVNTWVQKEDNGRVDAVVLAWRAERVVAITVAFGWDRDRQRWMVTELCTPQEDDRAMARAHATE